MLLRPVPGIQHIAAGVGAAPIVKAAAGHAKPLQCGHLGAAMGHDDQPLLPFGKGLVNEVGQRFAHPVAEIAPALPVRVGGVPVELTFKEYALLHLFLEHPEEVLARERIMKDVWDTDDLLESRTIDMHVRTLRQKLGAAGEAIRTVRKVGYKLSTEGSDD